MSHVIFYEKPGCAGNAKQKALLRAAGHSLEVRSLLAWPWDAQSLLDFLAPLPVCEWFNRSAPQLKSGEIVPELLNQDQALALLLAQPLLIRRPLMLVGSDRMVGFDAARVNAWVGLAPGAPSTNLEGCVSKSGDDPPPSSTCSRP